MKTTLEEPRDNPCFIRVVARTSPEPKKTYRQRQVIERRFALATSAEYANAD